LNMKKNLFLFGTALCFLHIVYAQQSVVVLPKKTYAVKEICKTAWDSPKGLSYKKVAGANLGVTSFEVMDKKRVAFLSDAVNEIVIAEKLNGNALSRFVVAANPRDFVYDKNKFYVLCENAVFVYDEKGTLVKTISYRNSFVGVARITRYNNGTYLLLPSGNSVQIENAAGNQVTEAHKGWITASGAFISGKLNGTNSYMVQVNVNGKNYEKVFTSNFKTAGVYVVGCTQNTVVLDVQTYVSESPIQVERHLISIELNVQGLGEITSDIKMLDCYYVLSNKDVAPADDGSVLNMVSAPQGVLLFSLTPSADEKAPNYPTHLRTIKYHFNDHLLQTNEQK
jgi:hypothetical protein